MDIRAAGYGAAKVNLLAQAASKASQRRAVAQRVVAIHAAAISDVASASKVKNRKVNRDKERLRSDIAYLHGLAQKIERRTDIDEDEVQARVRRETSEAVTLLKERQIFWSLCGDN